tara:strand:+ start:571 stop:1056 length:486 start_codon:yes stop_codon:yes gene_type:complete
MPALSQNLTRFEHDGAFELVFTVTNAGTTLGVTNFCAWWGLGNGDSVSNSTSILKRAYTAGGVSFTNTASGFNDCSSTADLVSSDSNDLTIIVSNTTVKISWTFAEFADITPTSTSTSKDYYHELVLMERNSSTCHQCRSEVVAAGVLTCTPSLFTNRPYR